MKNYHSGKIVFALLFINVNINAGAELRPFTYYRQEGTLACWAACLRMVMDYYGVIIDEERAGKERDIRRLAFNAPDTALAPNRSNEIDSAGKLLLRLLITAGNASGNGYLSQDGVRYFLDRGLPIIAGTRLFQNGAPVPNYGHMYVIMGYTMVGDTMVLRVANPAPIDTDGDNYEFREYSEFIDASNYGNGNNNTEMWVETIYIVDPPLTPPIKNTVVDKIAVKNKTITSALEALKRDVSNSGSTTRAIHVWDTVATLYEERVVIDSDVSNVRIMSDQRFSRNPVLKFPRAIQILGARGIELDGIDIESDSAVYNAGELALFPLKISAASGPAIQNSGELLIRYATNYPDKIVNVEAKSDHAIYNTGAVTILNGTISAPSGYAAINNENINGTLALGGTPTITGRIAGFGAGRVSVYTSGSSVFAPGLRKYVLDQVNFRDSDVVVIGGANYINNFELTDTNRFLAVKGNNLIVTSSLAPLSVSEDDAPYWTIFDAVLSALPGQVLNVDDDAVYDGQVTIDSALSGVTLRFKNKSLFSKPKIRYFSDNRNVPPRRYAEMLKMQSDVFINGDDVKENSALRVFGATGVLIDGIDIEGDNAVYNTGAVTIRNGTVSAVSDCAIYNTGAIEITNADVLAASGYAIYNGDAGGSLVLGGSPVITGQIAGFGAGKVGVYTFGDDVFTPGNKKYALSPYNLRSGDVAVSGGAAFIGNFELTDTNFILATKGNDLIAVALYTVSFNLNGGDGEEIPGIARVLENSNLSEAQMPSADGIVKTGYVGDGKWYALSDSGYGEFVFGENGTPITGNTTLYLKWTPIVSVLTPERTVPAVNVVGDIVAAVPIGAMSGGFTAGPIPVNKQIGAVNFFRPGNGMENGVLRIYDASGNFVKKITLSGKGKALHGSGMRVVGAWDLKDANGRVVPDGTYLVRGVIKTPNRKPEKVAVVLGVAR